MEMAAIEALIHWAHVRGEASEEPGAATGGGGLG